MRKIKRIPVILSVAGAFCLVLVTLAQAGPGAVESPPIWNIIQDGTDKSIKWVDHEPNRRFAIHDPGTPGDKLDDLVLDKETGLIWARNANMPKGTQTWQDAINFCRNIVQLGNRKGWRLPTIEELLSLIDVSETNPSLPKGHPFINVQGIFYWSSTTYESSGSRAWFISMGVGFVQVYSKTVNYFVWPVRGGNGYATGRW